MGVMYRVLQTVSTRCRAGQGSRTQEKAGGTTNEGLCHIHLAPKHLDRQNGDNARFNVYHPRLLKGA